MTEIGVRELKQKTSEIIRKVREARETFTITVRGHVVARLVPVESDEERRTRAKAAIAELDRIAEELAPYWPAGVTAEEAVSEQRR